MGSCYRVQDMKAGYSITEKPTVQGIQEAVARINETSILKIQKMVHFKEIRSGKDFAYFLERAIWFNEWSSGQRSSHLLNKSVLKNSFMTVYDYDLKLELMVIIILFICICLNLSKK